MGRFCGIDPSLIDDILEAEKEKVQKEMIQKNEDKKETLTKEKVA